MNDASLVRRLKRRRNLAGDRKRLSQWNGTFFDALRQDWALDQFHDQVIRSDVV